MSKITVLPHPEYCPKGASFDVVPNRSLCQQLLDNHIAIEHACDMSAACTTCHIIVRDGFYQLPEMDDIEADLLDRAWGLEAESRLSCQMTHITTDLTVEIPKYTINHASERNP